MTIVDAVDEFLHRHESATDVGAVEAPARFRGVSEPCRRSRQSGSRHRQVSFFQVSTALTLKQVAGSVVNRWGGWPPDGIDVPGWWSLEITSKGSHPWAILQQRIRPGKECSPKFMRSTSGRRSLRSGCVAAKSSHSLLGSRRASSPGSLRDGDYWARELIALGYEARLMPPNYESLKRVPLTTWPMLRRSARRFGAHRCASYR